MEALRVGRTACTCVVVFAFLAIASPAGAQTICARTLIANVVALDQPLTFNRLGAGLPGGMMFALQRDVCAPGGPIINGQETCGSGSPSAGNVMLKPYKRPRPLVLRMNQGDCLQINFTNLLNSSASNGQTPTRAASVHAQGLELLSTVPANCTGTTNGATCNDGSYVGQNPNGLVGFGGRATYSYFAAQQGTFLLYSTGDNSVPSTLANAGDGGTLAFGLFGAVHVEPRSSLWYRSQVTQSDLQAAGNGTVPTGQPRISYTASYSNTATSGCYLQGLCRTGPVLSMLCLTPGTGAGSCVANEIVHGDLTALITGPNTGRFTQSANPELQSSYALPDRQEPFREFTIVYHEAFQTTQAFPLLYTTGRVSKTFVPGGDFFGFNYGMGGIGSEILANRLGVGPMKDCPECKYEEFFLTSWAVGDPAMLVDNPATNSCPTPTTGLCLDNVTSCTTFGSTSTPAGCGVCTPQYKCPNPTPATRAFFSDDPSNVYHSYIGDHTKFRILHAGVDLHHLHHQHAHQWVHSPDSPNGDYTDSQSIGPGTAFTLETVYNGSGNVNQTVGDSIFHCHFYPHFAAGMWAMWRVHDVFEAGTRLGADGRPVISFLPGGGGQVTTARALPDGEIITGTPIPALVPLPTLPMAPLPAQIQLTNNGTRVAVCGPLQGQSATGCLPTLATSNSNNIILTNPGYPFFIPGIGGHRSPHPPLDFAYACRNSGQVCDPDSPPPQCGSGDTCAPLDGGLPRHIITGCGPGTSCTDSLPVNLTDFSKTLLSVAATQLPELGTVVEKTAMKAHSTRFIPSSNPDGGQTTVNAWNPSTTRPSNFIYNGLPPVQGAPYADPCIQYQLNGGTVSGTTRRYYAADIQLGVTFNQQGWHYPQQRMLSLWGDVQNFLSGSKAPEPLFVRANSGDCVDYALANLVPNVYELDDFQVRTPTDIIGQHIHLVKFDVTSSDGATNGFNYEDGTFSPNEVTERIRAINQTGGLESDGRKVSLTAGTIPFFGPGPGGRWVGAQATVQRWYADPLFDGRTTTPQAGAKDRTLRTVFTHDHFGPSSHQQAGLYAGVVVEPPGSRWYLNESTSTTPFGGQGVPSRSVTGANGVGLADGGPTTWQAVIVPGNLGVDPSFREFLLEVQDSTLTYAPFGILPSTNFGGFCSNNGAACTPATVTSPASGCSAGAVCYANGFCSNNLARSCRPGTSTSGENVSNCGYSGATCNFVAGVPGQNLGSPNLAAWNTTPFGVPLAAKGSNPPQVELITLAGATNNFSFNYRNEPFFPRITNPQTGALNSGTTGDLSFVYASLNRGNVNGYFCSNNLAPCSSAKPCSGGATCDPGGFCASDKICTAKNVNLCRGSACSVGGKPYPALTQGVQTGDPFTPLMRAYSGDNVQVRVLMGAHINPHNLSMHGLKWLMEPSFVDSGWRNSQVMGISEHFEQVVRMPAAYNSAVTSDFLFQAGAAAVEQAGGNWGLLRSYGTPQSNLQSLAPGQVPVPLKASSVCPNGSTPRPYGVVATTVKQATGGTLFYNNRNGAQVQDPNAIVYLNLNDLSCPGGQSYQSCTLKPGLTVQPLVLRAAAGDCVQVILYNAIIPSVQGLNLTGASSPVGTFPASNTSTDVGLHPQLVNLDVRAGDGANVGYNPTQTVAACTGTCSCGPNSAARVNCAGYNWYAGNYDPAAQAFFPIEFGAANLQPSDSINHFQHGLFGALIVEPAGSTWTPLSGTAASYTSAVVTPRTGRRFKEFVLITQDGLPAYQNAPPQTPVLGGDNLNAINYGAEILNNGAGGPWRFCKSSSDVSCWLSSITSFCCSQTDGNGTCKSWATACGDPQTPVLQACVGDPVRIRLLHAGGINTNNSFELHGHVWSEAPYRSQATSQYPNACVAPTTYSNLQAAATIGSANLCSPDPLSVNEWEGSKIGHGPGNHFDVLIERAGGTAGVAGDYLFRSYPGFHYNLGNWGILRVLPSSNPACQSSGGASSKGAAAAGGAGR